MLVSVFFFFFFFFYSARTNYSKDIYNVRKNVYVKHAVLLNFIFIKKRQANQHIRMNSEGSCHTGIMLK